MLLLMSEDTETDVAVVATEEVVIELDRQTTTATYRRGRHAVADRALGRIAGTVFVRNRFLRNVYGARRRGQRPDGEQRRARG